jgi:hypothetical protein
VLYVFAAAPASAAAAVCLPVVAVKKFYSKALQELAAQQTQQPGAAL